MSTHNGSRRKFIKTAAYAAPAIVTLQAMPTFARAGSVLKGNNGCGQEMHGKVDGTPPGLIKNGKGQFNDDLVVGKCKKI